MERDLCALPEENGGETSAPYPYAIELDDVTLSFDNEAPVLKNLSLRVAHGETRVILGRSGVGKSTVLKLALGLLRPDSGRVRIFGTDITDMSERDLGSIRHRIGMVFQGGALFDSLSVGENVGFCLLERHHVPPAQAEPIIRERLKYVGMEDSFSLMPSELSGGMIKRVAVARATLCQPELMLYDEPTSGLDPIATQKLVKLINRLRDDAQVTSVVVTHILRDARNVADTVTMIHDGAIIFDGAAEDIYDCPDPFVREFVAQTREDLKHR